MERGFSWPLSEAEQVRLDNPNDDDEQMMP